MVGSENSGKSSREGGGRREGGREGRSGGRIRERTRNITMGATGRVLLGDD